MEINFQKSFNARNLDPKEIAENFIYSPGFDILKNKSHTIILGARGCGKTTLMKMLSLPALYNWEHSQAKTFINEIPFYSIYIPTDISWQYKEISLSDYNIDTNLLELISKFSVNTNIFESVCETFLNIIEYELPQEEVNNEVNFCLSLIEYLKLPNNTVPRLLNIRESLKLRRNYINENLSKKHYNKEYEFEYSNFLYLNYIDLLPIIFEAFDRIFQPQKKYWALCFDELEFAPAWLKKQLYSLLRSTDQKLLFKLSSSPIFPKEVNEVFESDSAATLGNDFEIIKMWEVNSQSNNEFSKELISSLLRKRKITIPAKEYFGSNFRFIDGQESYGNDSDYLVRIKQLAEKDNSFKHYLESKSINPADPIPTDKSQHSAVFRKIKPFVYYRNYFIKENTSSKLSLNNKKKSIELYSGYEILSSITDGNPRWLIGLINSILDRANLTKAEANIQYDEIIKTSSRFANFIDNTPLDTELNTINLPDLIERVGNFFKNSLLGRAFDAEPYSTFTIEGTEANLSDAIEKGLLQGAFILVNDTSQQYVNMELKNKRFRLSYLYCPLFNLPLRISKSAKVDTMISENLSIPNLFNYEN